MAFLIEGAMFFVFLTIVYEIPRFGKQERKVIQRAGATNILQGDTSGKLFAKCTEKLIHVCK